jgi:hypothetical protein
MEQFSNNNEHQQRAQPTLFDHIKNTAALDSDAEHG